MEGSAGAAEASSASSSAAPAAVLPSKEDGRQEEVAINSGSSEASGAAAASTTAQAPAPQQQEAPAPPPTPATQKPHVAVSSSAPSSSSTSAVASAAPAAPAAVAAPVPAVPVSLIPSFGRSDKGAAAGDDGDPVEMAPFVLKALEKLRSTAGFFESDLKEMLDSTSKAVQEAVVAQRTARKSPAAEDSDADKYFRAFAMALEAKRGWKTKVASLDAVEKMIAYGYLRGAMRVKQQQAAQQQQGGGSSSSNERFLIDIVIESICSCRDDASDAVQLQVIKALLTAITCPTCVVREQSLLLSVRAVYHIFLVSRNAVNKNTAKATLRQMLVYCFQRMEAAQQRLNAGLPLNSPGAATTHAVAALEGGGGGGKTPSPAASSSHADGGSAAAAASAEAGGEPATAAPAAVSNTSNPSNPSHPLPGSFHPSSTSPDALDLHGFPSPHHRDAFLLFRALCRLSMRGDEDPLLPQGLNQLPAGGPSSSAAAATAAGAESGAGAMSTTAGGGGGGGGGAAVILTDEALLNDPVALHSKLLALDLVLALLESAGPAFRTGPRFIQAIKTILCVGLLKNILSTIPAVASTALKVFLALMRGFKHHLASEIEVFISTVFLKLLHSPHSSYDQKVAVLTAFRSITGDAASLLEIFLNFDCSATRQNLFEDSVNTLASIAQGRTSDEFNQSQKNAQEASAVKFAALQCLGSIMQSIVVMADATIGVGGSSVAANNAQAALAAATAAMESALASQQQGGGSGSGSGSGGIGHSSGSSSSSSSSLSVPLTGAAAVGSGGSSHAAANDDAVSSSSSSSSSSGDANSGTPSASSSSSSSSLSASAAATATSAASSASAALARSYEDQRKRRANLEKAAIKFANKPKDGIAFMQEVGLCKGTTAEEVAACLHDYRDVLDKTAIGEYLGEEKPFNVAVLHAYVDHPALDFTGLGFMDAVRLYLSYFRIPGEAQKVDRIMEKMAQRYCYQNPTIFPSADTAFVLSFSMIMLQTDAHNPNIKPERKMTRQGFINNNRGIANGGDLPSDFLGAIYDSIVSHPITLKEDDARRLRAAGNTGGGGGSADERMRKIMQAQERAQMVAAGQKAMVNARRQQQQAQQQQHHHADGGHTSLLHTTSAAAFSISGGAGAGGDASGQNEAAATESDTNQQQQQPSSSASSQPGGGGHYFTIADVDLTDHVQPIFEVAWAPLLAVFSVVLETSGDDDPRTINAALIGMAQAVHVACVLKMATPRDALVQSLCRFTFLEPGAGVREMRHKNVACTRALLNIAFNEGDRLGSAWGPVLVCVSTLARLLNVAAGGKEDSAFFFEAAPNNASGASGGAAGGGGGINQEMLQRIQEREAAIERVNAALISAAIQEADVTRIYTRSTSLNGDAIVDFVTQLAAVSLQELQSAVSSPLGFPAVGQTQEEAHAQLQVQQQAAAAAAAASPVTQGGNDSFAAPAPAPASASSASGRRTSRASSIALMGQQLGSLVGVGGGSNSGPSSGRASLGGSSGSSSANSGAGMRVFSLQKVVEVADYNITSRPRMTWTKVWEALSPYFASVCCSGNAGIAMYGIDCLKQLSTKFLEKPELKAFHFQTKFLQPFLMLMESSNNNNSAGNAAGGAGKKASQQHQQQQLQQHQQRKGSAAAPSSSSARRGGPSAEIRELILHVCANLIRAKHANIRSGWSTFMGVFAAAAGDSDELLVSLAFGTVHEVLTAHFDEVAAAGAFTDAVRCMIAFGGNQHHTLFALRAIDHCATLGAHLARGRVPLTEDAVDGFYQTYSKGTTYKQLPTSAAANSPAFGAGASGATGLAASSSSSLASNTGGGFAVGGEGSGDEGNNNSSKSEEEWYDIEGGEHADVVESEKALLAQSSSSSSAAAESSNNNNSSGKRSRKPSGSAPASGDANNIATTAAGGGGADSSVSSTTEDASNDVYAHENATDAAMLLADQNQGGKIRRFADSRLHIQLWWPLLTGLARLVSSDTRLPIRMRALHALFALLRRYGPGFSLDLWRLVYSGVLMPIFDDVRQAGEEQQYYSQVQAAAAAQQQQQQAQQQQQLFSYSLSDFATSEAPKGHVHSASSFTTNANANAKPQLHQAYSLSGKAAPGSHTHLDDKEASAAAAYQEQALLRPMALDAEAAAEAEALNHEWLRTTCMPALSSLVRLQTRFFVRLRPLLPQLLGLIASCIDQEVEGLARIGVACTRQLLAEAGPRFDSDAWEMIASFLQRLFEACTPHPLLQIRDALLGRDDDEEEAEEEQEQGHAAASASAAAGTKGGKKRSYRDRRESEHREGDGAFTDEEDGANVLLAETTTVASSSPSVVDPSSLSDEELNDRYRGLAIDTPQFGRGVVTAVVTTAAANAQAANAAAAAAASSASASAQQSGKGKKGGKGSSKASAPVASVAPIEGHKGVAFVKVQFPWGATASLHYPALVTASSSADLEVRLAEKKQAEAAAAAEEKKQAAAAAVPAPSVRTVNPDRLDELDEEEDREEEEEQEEEEEEEVIEFNSVRVITQCVVQLELISAIGVLADAHLGSLKATHVHTLLQLLQDSAEFARRFNADRPLRRALWESGFMRFARANKLPSLLRQETAATQQLLLLLLKLYTSGAGVAAPDGPASSPTSAGSAGNSSNSSSNSNAWRGLALSHLRSLAERMVSRYTSLAIDAERARMLATPAYMHQGLQLQGVNAIAASSPSVQNLLQLQLNSNHSGGSGARQRGGSTAVEEGSQESAQAQQQAQGEGEDISRLLDGSGAIDRDLFREAASYGPLVGTLLEGLLLSFSDDEFSSNLHWIHPLLTGLIVAGNLEIRALVAGIFEDRVKPLVKMGAK